MRLDSKPINPQSFKPFGESRYAIAQIEVPYGTHTLEGRENFGFYSYGFGFGDDSYDAYGNMVGQSFLELREVKDTIPPMATLRTAPSSQASSNSRVNARNSIAQTVSKIIVSDDREDDKGLASVKILDAGGLNIVAPSISAGSPQAEIIINEQAQRQSGRAILELTDVAGNSQKITFCFTKDQLGSDNLLSVSEGVQDYCPQKTLWYWGAFGTLAATLHEASFSTFDRFRIPGTFTSSADGVIAPIGGGLVLGHRLSSWFGVSARLSAEILPGTLRAAGPVNTDPRFDTLSAGLDGRPFVIQQGYTLSLTSVHAALTLLGEFYLTNNFYAMLGMKAAFSLTRTIALKRIITTPQNSFYPETGTSERNVFTGAPETLASVLPSAVGGVGVTVPVWRNIAVFGEATYSYPLGTVFTTGNWRISQIGLNVGARLRF
jgi:hypothetical protein